MKYVLVEWPDIQLVMEDPEYADKVFMGLPITKEITSVYFVPEDLYNKYFENEKQVKK